MTSDRSPRLSQQVWFLCLLAAYAVLELSFNHRLLEWAAGGLPTGQAPRVQDMEIWARVVSGLGLALLLMRWLDGWIRSRLVLMVLSTTLGVVTVWHVQKAVVEAIVARADAQDLHMSVQGMLSTGEALKGRVELRGLPVLDGPAPPPMRLAMGALWASTVLGLDPEDLELSAGAAQLVSRWMPVVPPPEQLREAYRRVVIVPVALGASLFFGLFNICQFLAGLSAWLIGRWGSARIERASRRFLLTGWLLLCLVLSIGSDNPWADSPGYREVAQPALWQSQPLLAPFVEWSLRAELAWSDPVAWVHQHLLGDYDFRVPQPLRQVLAP